MYTFPNNRDICGYYLKVLHVFFLSVRTAMVKGFFLTVCTSAGTPWAVLTAFNHSAPQHAIGHLPPPPQPPHTWQNSQLFAHLTRQICIFLPCLRVLNLCVVVLCMFKYDFVYMLRICFKYNRNLKATHKIKYSP